MYNVCNNKPQETSNQESWLKDLYKKGGNISLFLCPDVSWLSIFVESDHKEVSAFTKKVKIG